MNRHKILVADDDELILSVISKGLEKEGYEVIAAGSGDDAVRRGIEAQPDLAVLDIRMPGMDGIEAARELRKQADIDSIFLTAYSDKELVDTAIKEGALGYLVKPVDIHQLVPSIQAALERSAELRRLYKSEANLTDAINSNREISVAIGIYMERFQVSDQEAFESLRSYARSQRHKLIDIARAMTRETTDNSDLINRIKASR
ncbi:MAG: response regulator [Candidatus Sedimenticola sp. 20ELBAFRAG]